MTATNAATNANTNINASTRNPFRKIHAMLLHGTKAWTLLIVVTATILYTGIFTANPVTAVIGLALFAVIVIAAYVTAAKRASE